MGWLKRWDERAQRYSETINAQTQAAEAAEADDRHLTKAEQAMEGLYQFKAIRMAVIGYLGLIVLIFLAVRWIIGQF